MATPTVTWVREGVQGVRRCRFRRFLDEEIELHPSTDRWMMGDRMGTVEKKGLREGRPAVYVHLARSGKKFWFSPKNLLLPKRARFAR